MRKKLVFILCFIILLCGCNSNKISGNPDPPSITSEDRSIHSILQIDEDSSYNEIYAESKEAKYNSNEEYISCKIINKNHGKGFYFYEIPFIEKNINGKWVRLLNTSNQSQVAEWLFCGIEGNNDISYSADVNVYLKDIEPKMDEGLYRFVIFTAERVLYAEFNLY